MRQAVLLGNCNTKRTDYFRQAAGQAGLPVLFVDWKDIAAHGMALGLREFSQGEGCFMKIDPPLWESCSLEEMDKLTEDYLGKLEELACMAQHYNIEFLNHPLAIATLMDKRACKEKLSRAGLPVTQKLEAGVLPMAQKPEAEVLPMAQKPEAGVLPMAQKPEAEVLSMAQKPEAGVLKAGQGAGAEGAYRGQQLLGKLMEVMRKNGVCQVFLKPAKGSGAAGVSAFRWQPSTGRMALYTCALEHPDLGLVNMKRLRRFSRPGEVLPLLGRILELGCVIERWYAKAEYEGFSYDLRAVVLDGRIDFLLARLSKGPITNLHLNNRPLDAGKLGLPASVWEGIADLCWRAMECFPGLRSAGIDILLEKGSLKPRIIEMNAQGDLIYLDIFHENIIYRNQAEVMRGICNNFVEI